MYYISVVDYKEPESYEEAITGSDAEKWKEAMSDEIDSLKKNQTWTLVDP